MKKTLARTIALTAALTLGTANMSIAAGGSIGHGDISVYKEGQLTTKLTGNNPIEDGSMLVCDGKCMVKSEGISLIAEDKSQIAVTNETETFKLYVKEGQVDYVISNNARKIAFYTPQGTYTVAEAVFNASGNSAVKGSVIVGGDGSTEIVVREGKMVFATADGMKTVDANQKLVLAAGMEPPPAATGAANSAYAEAAAAGATTEDAVAAAYNAAIKAGATADEAMAAAAGAATASGAVGAEAAATMAAAAATAGGVSAGVIATAFAGVVAFAAGVAVYENNNDDDTPQASGTVQPVDITPVVDEPETPPTQDDTAASPA